MTQTEEFAKALKENRQPICVGCGKPLDRVIQHQYEDIGWEWDEDEEQFVKAAEDGGADKPYHAACDYADWDLVEGSEEAVKLGLTF